MEENRTYWMECPACGSRILGLGVRDECEECEVPYEITEDYIEPEPEEESPEMADEIDDPLVVTAVRKAAIFMNR